MSLERLAQAGEFLGGLAGVVSIVYLAIQVRQNTDSGQAQSELGLNERFANWCGRVSDHPDLSRIWDLAASDPDSMTEEDVRPYRWLAAELSIIYEGWFQLYRRGVISDYTWVSKMDALKVLLAGPILAEWWESRMTPMSEGFRAHMDALAGTESSWKQQPISTRRRLA